MDVERGFESRPGSMSKRIPSSATVTVNVNSTVNALRDMATLMERGGITEMIWVMQEGLPMLANRIEEMWKEQNKDDE
jgi:hypothetical protein